MEICRICGTPLQPGKIDSITTETGEKCICIACGTQVKALIKQAEPSAAAARSYFKQRRLRTIDPEVKAYLAALCGENEAVTSSPPASKPPDPQTNPQKDYWGAGAKRQASESIGGIDSSFWISSLKVVMAVLFFAILLGGGNDGIRIGQRFFGGSHLIFSLLLAVASITGGMWLLHTQKMFPPPVIGLSQPNRPLISAAARLVNSSRNFVFKRKGRDCYEQNFCWPAFGLSGYQLHL